MVIEHYKDGVLIYTEDEPEPEEDLETKEIERIAAMDAKDLTLEDMKTVIDRLVSRGFI